MIRSRSAALGEIAGLVAVLLVFTRLHNAAGKDVAAADANALSVRSIERGLHVDVEPAANRWLTDHPALIPPAVYHYRLYYVVLLGAVVWIYLRRPEAYLLARRTFVAMTLLVLPVYWLLPLSPPRLALPGIVDIVAQHDIFARHSENEHSAMPSLHVGWSAWCAFAVWSALRADRPRAALLAWVFPLLMAADVLATGNHYVLDIAGSVVLLALSIAVAAACGRVREKLEAITARRASCP